MSFAIANKLRTTATSLSSRTSSPLLRRFSLLGRPSVMLHARALSTTAVHVPHTSQPSSNGGGCPFGFHHKKRAAAAPITDMPGYKTFPLLGSLPYLGMPLELEGKTVSMIKDVLDVHRATHLKWGPVYRMSIPGMGDNVSCSDPVEFMKVMENQDLCPFGAVEGHWPTKAVFKRDGNETAMKFFASGEEWRNLRQNYSKDLLNPSSLKGYVPGMSKAASSVTEVFDRYEDDMATFCSRASFDVTSSVLFGKSLDITVDTLKDPSKGEFCDAMARASANLLPNMMNPWEVMLNSFNYESAKMKDMREDLGSCYGHAREIVESFVERREKGELSEEEQNSYVSLNIAKQQKLEALTPDELKEVVVVLLNAGGETTSGMLIWNLITLALNPEVQEKARQEVSAVESVSQAMGNSGLKGSFPYLNNIIRETHRIRPAVPISLAKKPNKDIELCGFTVPKETIVFFSSHSLNNDASLWGSDVKEFKPERWSADAVEARKGTPQEVLDHPFLRNPFSAGARMCPGSRVAQRTLVVMLAHILRNYRFSLKDVKSLEDLPVIQGTTVKPTQMPKFVVTKI